MLQVFDQFAKRPGKLCRRRMLHLDFHHASWSQFFASFFLIQLSGPLAWHCHPMVLIFSLEQNLLTVQPAWELAPADVSSAEQEGLVGCFLLLQDLTQTGCSIKWSRLPAQYPCRLQAHTGLAEGLPSAGLQWSQCIPSKHQKGRSLSQELSVLAQILRCFSLFLRRVISSWTAPWT